MVLIQLGLLGFGMVTMFARPLYPAFSDAATRLDTEWLQAARRKVNLWALPVALVIIGSLALLGPWFIRHWIPDNPHVFSWQECGLYGITFTALIWTHVHYVMMAGTNKAGPIAVTGVMEAGLAIVLITSGIQKFGLDGALASCAVASLLTSAWMLPVSVRRHFRELESRRTAGSGNPGALATP